MIKWILFLSCCFASFSIAKADLPPNNYSLLYPHQSKHSTYNLQQPIQKPFRLLDDALIKKKFDKSQIAYGGNISAFFGNITFFEIGPMLGYKLNKIFIPGIALNYRYYRESFPPAPPYSTSLYGGSIFLRAYVKNPIFLHAEYEWLNFAYNDILLGPQTRRWSASPLVGGGYQSGPFFISVLYALSSGDPKSPYFNNALVFRAGVFIVPPDKK